MPFQSCFIFKLKTVLSVTPSKLNRTLLIPPFFRHTNDVNNEHASLLNPELVIDIQELSKFVSIAPYSRAHEICRGKIGSILLSRNCNTGPQYERLKEFEAYSKLKFLRKGSAKHFCNLSTKEVVPE